MRISLDWWAVLAAAVAVVLIKTRHRRRNLLVMS